jgi:electron transfer flavoprotein alpha subunit
MIACDARHFPVCAPRARTSRPFVRRPICCLWPAPDGPRSRLILGFLHAAQASLGGSKSLVDLSGEGQAVLPFMTHLNQVGQTGSTPRHPKGLATCCHGEEPHVVGWRFINERRAINLDPNCGWARGKADVLYVADAFAVIEQLNQLLVSGRQTVPA